MKRLNLYRAFHFFAFAFLVIFYACSSSPSGTDSGGDGNGNGGGNGNGDGSGSGGGTSGETHIPFQVSADMMMNINLSNKGGELHKAGLGSLFGLSNIGGQPSDDLISGSQVFIVAHQNLPGKSNPFPTSTSAIADKIEGTSAKIIARFNDMIPGFAPYQWQGYDTYMNNVEGATKEIKNNYKDEVLCIEVFNEPDVELNTPEFNNDPKIEGDTYNERVNYLWTQTVKKIHSIMPDMPVMGPNYETYRPDERNEQDQDRMRAFLKNAKETNTVPKYIGWHNLLPQPTEIPRTLNNYLRPLETELGLPGSPHQIIVDEFDVGKSGDNHNLEGVPGSLVTYWGQFARAGIDYASAGIYSSPGLLGNIIRYTYEQNPKPNGGWYMFHWYHDMKGVYVPVDRPGVGRNVPYDGVASYDKSDKKTTVLFGGANGNAKINFNGANAIYGNEAHIKLQATVWDVFKNASNSLVVGAGDPQSGTYTVFNRNMAIGDADTLSIPVSNMKEYNGYRITLTPSSDNTGKTNGKYEAENAEYNNAKVFDDDQLYSNSSYLGNLNKSDSKATFNVHVASAGIYKMRIRYSLDEDTGKQDVAVNGSDQGTIEYKKSTFSNSWGIDVVQKRVQLNKGDNTIELSHNTGSIELDYINLKHDMHRYEAEFANVNKGDIATFNVSSPVPDYVGSINATDAYVEFNIDAPKSGTFLLHIAYANNTDGTAINDITVNERAAGVVELEPTGGWFAAPSPNNSRGFVDKNVNLNAGWNAVRLTKKEGFAELDYIKLLTADGKPKVKPTGLMNSN